MVLCFLITDVRVELRHSVPPWLPHLDYWPTSLLSLSSKWFYHSKWGGVTKTLRNSQKEILSLCVSIECISLSHHCDLLKKKKLRPTIVSIYISGLLPLQPARGAFFCPLLWSSRGTVKFRNLTRIGAVQVQRRMRTKLGHSTWCAGVGVGAVPGGSAAPPHTCHLSVSVPLGVWLHSTVSSC